MTLEAGKAQELALATLRRWRFVILADPETYRLRDGDVALEEVDSTLRALAQVCEVSPTAEPAPAKRRASPGPHPDWNCGGEMSSKLVLLAEHDPRAYEELTAGVEAGRPVTFQGILWMYSALRAIGDDHDFVLHQGTLLRDRDVPGASVIRPRQMLAELDRRLEPIADLLELEAPRACMPVEKMAPFPGPR